MKEIIFLILLLLSAVEAAAWTQSAPNVPIDDPVYRQIDRLVAAGLVKDVIYGQRPWSRSEVTRIIAEAIAHREKIGPPIAPDDREISLWLEMDDLLQTMKDRFREEPKQFSLHPLSFVEAQYIFVDSDARPVIQNNGLGAIDAVLSPLTAYREGRHYPDGHQFAVETEHYARLTRFFSFYVRPRFQIEIHDDKDVEVNPFVQQLYAKLTVPHFELEVGRDSIEWGQGEFGGILLSNNARPLDMIKLSNPSPTILPWLLKYLGPFRYTLFVANLGPEREFPRSFLTGFKVSSKPVAFFEMGFSQLIMLGGEGAPGPLTVGNVVGEFFGKRSEIANLANRETGFDFRFFIPVWNQMQVYVDVQFEDDSEDRIFQITDLANYQAGFYFPALTSAGNTSLRLEYRHGSPYFYRHSPFTTGMTLNRRILGDELGPQADGGYVTFSHDLSQKVWMKYFLGYERRDGDDVNELKDPDRHLVVLTPRPAETRLIATFKGTYTLNPKLLLNLEFGYERVFNFNFVSGDGRNGFLANAGLRFNLF